MENLHRDETAHAVTSRHRRGRKLGVDVGQREMPRMQLCYRGLPERWVQPIPVSRPGRVDSAADGTCNVSIWVVIRRGGSRYVGTAIVSCNVN